MKYFISKTVRCVKGKKCSGSLSKLKITAFSAGLFHSNWLGLSIAALAVSCLIPKQAEAAYAGSGTFNLITDPADITSGGYYVFVGGATFGATAMGTLQAGSYVLTVATVTTTGGSITDPPAGIVWRIDGESTCWSIYNEPAGYYIGHRTSVNSVSTAAATAARYNWTFVTTASSALVARNKESTARVILYNSGSPRFACYTSTAHPIRLYKMASAASAPSVTTVAASATNTTTATANGNVTADGGASITNRGVCYKTTAGVAISDNKTACSSNGTGVFSASLSSLSVNQIYYFKAYAQNSAGTTLGSELSFTTLANVPSAPTVNNPSSSTLDVTINENGNPAATEFCIIEENSTDFVQADGTLGADPVWQTKAVWGTVTVSGLAASTEYIFSVAARNGEDVETDLGANASETTLSASSPASISTQPDEDYAACSGSSVNMTVSASGTTPIKYAWRKRGAGWGSSWSITAGGGGTFLGSSAINGDGSTTNINTGGQAFGLYNNSGATTEATRDFAALATGGVFYVEMDNGWVTGGKSVGIALQNSGGTTALEIFFEGGDSNYTINRNGGQQDSGIGYTDDGLEITLTNVTSTTYSMMIKVRGGSTYGPFTGTYLNSVSSISRFRAWNYNAGSGDAYNFYVNNLRAGAFAHCPLYDDNAGNYSSWTGDKGQGPLANGGDISGATTNSLTISNLESGDAAYYDVIVYNNYGGESSSTSRGELTVNAAPTITLGGNPTVYAMTNANLTYSGTSGSPNQYSINYDATAEAAGLTDVAYTALPSSPIAIGIPFGTATGVYSAALKVKNTTTGCESSSNAITVTISAPQSRNTSGGASPGAPAGTIYLGDRNKVFTFESWGTIGANWGQARLWRRAGNADLRAGTADPWGGAWVNSDGKSVTSGTFNVTGTWYWGIQMNYDTAYGTNFWYKASSADWVGMAWDGSGATLQLTVSALDNPSSQTATRDAVNGTSEIDLSWTRDAYPHDVMVVRKLSTDAWTEPTQGVTYNASDTIGAGTVIYRGSSTSFSDTGLTANRTYDYKFYSENWSYYSAGVTAQASTLAAEPGASPNTLSFSAFEATGMTISWAGMSTQVLVSVRASSDLSADPSDGTTYTADADYTGGGTALGGGKVVYKGTGTTVTVSGLSPGVTYYVRVYNFNGGAGAENYRVSDELSGNAPTCPAAPAIAAASGVGITSFTGNWAAAVGAASYRLDVSTNASFAAGGGGDTLLETGFEGMASLPAGWTENSSAIQNNASYAHSGTYCESMNAAADWFCTPVLTNIGTVSFWVRTSSDPGGWTMKVQISSNNTDWTDYASIVEDGAGGTISDTYVQTNVAVNLTGTNYVRWYMSARTADSVYIDDLTITGTGGGAPSYVAGFSNLTVGATLCAVTGLTGNTKYYYRVRAVNASCESTNSAVTNVTTLSGTADVALDDIDPQVTAANVLQGTTNHVLLQFSLAASVANATLTNVTFTTAGTYDANDLTNLKLRYSTDSTLSAGDATLATNASPAAAGAKTFGAANMSQQINSGSTGYFFITADIAADATDGNTVSINALSTDDVLFADANKSGSTAAGGAQTITPTTPTQLLRFNGFEGTTNDNWSWVPSTMAVALGPRANTNYAGSYSLMLSGSADSSADPKIVFDNVTLPASAGNVAVSVAYAASGADAGDSLHLDVSYDNGSTWGVSTQLVVGDSNLEVGFGSTVPGNTATENPCVFFIADNATNVRVRIRYEEASGDNRYDEFYVDDLKLLASVDGMKTVQFGRAETITNEAGGASFGIPVTISAAADATVQVFVAGTALAGGTDFAIAATNIVFAAGGATTSNLVVTINDDSTAEGPESVRFTLVQAKGCRVIGPDVHTLFIRDDEAFSIVAANLVNGSVTVGGETAWGQAGQRLLRALAPDIVAIQEWVVTNSFSAFVTENFGAGFYYVTDGTTGANAMPNGIISRWPILATNVWDDSVGFRQHLHAEIDLPGAANLNLVSVHLDAGGDAASISNRVAGARSLTNAIHLAGFDAGDYLCIAGDLNISNRTDEVCLQVLTAIVSDAEKPTDKAGSLNTNPSKTAPYDLVLPNTLLEAQFVDTMSYNGTTFASGMIFDTREWGDHQYPALGYDSKATNLTHSPVVKVFALGETVEPPASFTATTLDADSIELAFRTNDNGNTIVVVYDTDNTFTTPSGAAPSVSDSFAGGTVLYVGTGTNYTHNSLSSCQTYYYQTWSVSGTPTWSSELADSDTTETPSAPAIAGATNVTTTTFYANWAAAVGASSYRLDVSTNESFGGSSGSTNIINEGFATLTDTTPPSGWTASQSSDLDYSMLYGLASPCFKFSGAGQWLRSPAFSLAPTNVQFWTRGNGGSDSIISVSGLVNSVWTYMGKITNNTTGANYDVPLSAGVTQLLFTFEYKSVNSSLDDVLVTGSLGAPDYVTGYSNLTVSGVSQWVTGLVSDTKYYYRVRTAGGACVSTNSATTNLTTVAGTPDITLDDIDPQVSAANVAQGTTNHVVMQFSLAVTTAKATLTNVTFTTAGTHDANDLLNYKLRFSTNNSLDASDATLATNASPGTAGAKSFVAAGFSTQIQANATGYLFITADLASDATETNTFSVNALTTDNVQFAAGNKSGSTAAGGTQTIISSTIPAPGHFSVTPYDAGTMTLTFTNNGTTHDVVIVYDLDNTFSDPSGAPPSVGGSLGGGTLVYVGTNSTQSHTNLIGCTRYYYKAWSYNGVIYSAVGLTDDDTLPTPAVPTGLSTFTNETSFIASWTASAGATNYYIDVGTNQTFQSGGNPVYVAGYSNRLAGGSASVTVTGLTVDLNYYYRVRAEGAGCISANSSTQMVTTTVIVCPDAPTGLFASYTNTTSFTSQWDSVVDATGYRLDVATTSNFTGGATTALISENIQDWTPHGGYGNYTEEIDAGTVRMTNCIVQTDASADGPCTLGRVQMGATTGMLELPAVNGVGTVVFHLDAGGADRSVTLEKKVGGGAWSTVATISGISSSGAIFSNVVDDSSASVALRLNGPSAAIYVHDIIVYPYGAGNSYIPGYSNRTVAGTVCVVTGLTDETKYYYRVRAVSDTCPDGSANSGVSNVTTITAPSPAIGLGPTTISVTGAIGGTVDATLITVTNVGGRLLSYSVATNAKWLTVSPVTGTSIAEGGTNTHTVTYNLTGLSVGTSNATITLTGTGTGRNECTNSPQTVTVELVVQPIGNLSAASATADGKTMVDLAWTKASSFDVMIVHRAGSASTAPTQGSSYSVGGACGSGTVIYKGSGSTLEHVVPANSTNHYAFYSYSGNYYSDGLTASAVMSSFAAGEIVETFSYTSGVNLASCTTSSNGWSGAWSGETSTFTNHAGSFSAQVYYPNPSGNKILTTPAGGKTNRVTRGFSAITSGKIYASFILNYQYSGGSKWAGASLMHGSTEKIFFGECGGGDQVLGIHTAVDDEVLTAGSDNDYIIIMRYDFSTDDAHAMAYKIGTDSVPESEPATWEAEYLNVGGITQFDGIMLQAGCSDGVNTPGNVYFDEVRVSTNWSNLLVVQPPKIVYDGFESSADSISGKGGGDLWGANTWVLGGTDPYANNEAGSIGAGISCYFTPKNNKVVAYGDSNNRVVKMSRNFASPFTGGKVYFSWMQSYQNSGNDTWAGLSLLQGGVETAFVGKVTGASARLGIATSADNRNSEVDLTASTDYVIVGCYDFDTRELSATSYKATTEHIAEEPHGYWQVVTTQAVGGITSIDGVMLNSGGQSGNQVGYVYYDEIRVGTNWYEVARKDGESQVAAMMSGPTPTLIYVGTANFADVTLANDNTDITVTDNQLTNVAAELSVAVRWTSPYGVFMTNNTATCTNIGSRAGRVNPNWDPATLSTGETQSVQIGYDAFFNKFYGYNGALSVTTYCDRVFNITNSTVGDTYFMTVSAENNNTGGGTATAANTGTGGNAVPYYRALTVNSNLQFYIDDDDKVGPSNWAFTVNGVGMEGSSNIAAGGIAIIGVNGSPTTLLERFSFVVLAPFPAGTHICFSDCAWSTNDDAWLTPSDEFHSNEWYAVGDADVGTVFELNLTNINNAGDQIGVFQIHTNTWDPVVMSAGTNMHFVYGINVGSSTNWADESQIGNNSYTTIYRGLTNGYSCVAVHAPDVNCKYTGTTEGTSMELLLSISDARNWQSYATRVDLDLTNSFSFNVTSQGGMVWNFPELTDAQVASGSGGFTITNIVMDSGKGLVATSAPGLGPAPYMLLYDNEGHVIASNDFAVTFPNGFNSGWVTNTLTNFGANVASYEHVVLGVMTAMVVASDYDMDRAGDSIVTYVPLRVTVSDDDEEPPLLGGGAPPFLLSRGGTNLSNSGSNFSISLDEMANVGVGGLNPLRIVLNAYDATSGLSRATSEPESNTTISVANWFTSNVVNFALDESTPTNAMTDPDTTNVWKFTDVIASNSILAMYQARSNELSAFLIDADKDRKDDWLTTNVSVGWLTITPPRAMNSSALPGAPTNVFLGDTNRAFTADTKIIFNDAGDRSLLWIGTNANLVASGGKPGVWTSRSAGSEEVAPQSAQFTSTGSWYWAVQSDYAYYGTNFWYASSNAAWTAMSTSGASATLRVPVAKLERPVFTNAVTNSTTSAILQWTPFAARSNVLIIHNMTNPPSATVQGTHYTASEAIGSDGSRTIFKGYATIWTNTGEHLEWDLNWYAIYTENNGYYSLACETNVAGSPIWTGADPSSTYWGKGTNWSIRSVPKEENIATFYRSYSDTNVYVAAATAHEGILFVTNATTSLRIYGTRTNSIGAQGIKARDCTADQRIECPIELTADQSWSNAANSLLTFNDHLVGSFDIAKLGPGRMHLDFSSATTFDGLMSIGAGVISLGRATSLGATSAGTVVSNGAALELRHTSATTYSAEPLTLSGQGVSLGGALRSIALNNGWQGAITLADNARINSDADTLTLSGGISGSGGGGQNLFIGGTGTVTMTTAGLGANLGMLIKDGPGTGTIAVACSHTSEIIVSNGALRAQNAAALGTTDEGVTVISGGALELYGADIGAEALTLNGTGPGGYGSLLNVSGANDYGGAITVASDSLVNNAAAAALTLNGAIGCGANTLTVTCGNVVDINGALSGTKTTGDGAFVKNGAERLNLGGDNSSLTGNIVFNAGEVRLDVANALAGGGNLYMADGTILRSGSATDRIITKNLILSGGVTFGSNATYSGSLTFHGATDLGGGTRIMTVDHADGDYVDLKGIISNGGLSKAGPGLLILSSNNTYTAGTRVMGGTLQIGNAGTAGMVLNDITNDASVVFSRTDDTSFDGKITGTGWVTKASSGVLTMTNISTYSGGTLVSAGTLKGNALSLFGFITNNSVLQYDQAVAASNGAVVSGSGMLVKTGAGFLALTNSMRYTGATRVEAGTLWVGNISNASDLVIYKGAAASVTGYVGNAIITGRLSTARSATSQGTLNCTNLVLSSGAEIDVKILAGDRTNVINVSSNMQVTGVVTVRLSGVSGANWFQNIPLVYHHGARDSVPLGDNNIATNWVVLLEDGHGIPDGLTNLMTTVRWRSTGSGEYYIQGATPVVNITNNVPNTNYVVALQVNTMPGLDYDLIYMDKTSYSDTYTNINTDWKFAYRLLATNETMTFTNDIGSLGYSLSRFYRVSPLSAWSNAVGIRYASEQIYMGRMILLLRGRNWVSLPCEPIDRSVNNILGPGENLPAYSQIYIYTNQLVNGTNRMIVTDSYVTPAGRGAWQYTNAAPGNAGTNLLPLGQGFIVYVDTNAPTDYHFGIAGKMRTQTNEISIGGAKTFTYITTVLPADRHPSQLNLVESGFKGASLPRDRLYYYAGGTNTLAGYFYWYRTSDSQWIDSRNGQIVGGTPIKQNQSYIIYSAPTTPAWVWTNKLYYKLPTQNMNP